MRKCLGHRLCVKAFEIHPLPVAHFFEPVLLVEQNGPATVLLQDVLSHSLFADLVVTLPSLQVLPLVHLSEVIDFGPLLHVVTQGFPDFSGGLRS